MLCSRILAVIASAFALTLMPLLGHATIATQQGIHGQFMDGSGNAYLG